MEINNIVWDDLRVLLAVHRHRSLLAAGKSLGMSTSTTARRLAQLEHDCGTALVVRTTTGTRLETAAYALIELAEAMELGLRTAARHDPVTGAVRVSATDAFAIALVQALAEVRRRAPGICVEVLAEARVVDIARGEADIGLRTVRSTSAVVVQRPMGRLTFGVYAARSLVQQRLRSTTLTAADVARLEWVHWCDALAQIPQMRWLQQVGATRVAWRSNNDLVVHEAIKREQGVGVLAELVGDADDALVRLDVPHAPLPSIPVWLAQHRERRRAPAIRLVGSAIEAACRAQLAQPR